jgi:hypothetical protein
MDIVFCHNVYNRFKTLNSTIRIEKMIYPNSNSIVGYNNESPEEVLKGYDNIELIKFNGITHKIGCANGCITTIKAALKYNPDVIVFSHDDVYLNISLDSHKVFLENATMISSGKYDAICRKPLPIELYGNEYFLMEAFFISPKAAIECFIDESLIDKDVRGSISPEAFLYRRLKNENLNVLEIGYQHKLEDYNKTLSETMGYIHMNAGERGWKDK